ncbi:unnamed protein product [Symbiodinium sp. KB8]|nr:unnamed protein product [Symbiodinium sp. KB8]
MAECLAQPGAARDATNGRRHSGSRRPPVVVDAQEVSTSGDETTSSACVPKGGRRAGRGAPSGSDASAGPAAAAGAARMADTPSLGRFIRIEAGANSAVSVPPARLISPPGQSSKWVKCRLFRVGSRKLSWEAEGSSVAGDASVTPFTDCMRGLARGLEAGARREALARVQALLRWVSQLPGEGDRFVMVTESAARPALVAAAISAPSRAAAEAAGPPPPHGSGHASEAPVAGGTGTRGGRRGEGAADGADTKQGEAVLTADSRDEERAFVIAAPPNSQALRSIPAQHASTPAAAGAGRTAQVGPSPSLLRLPGVGEVPSLAAAAAVVAAIRPFASLFRAARLSRAADAALESADCDERHARYSCGPGEPLPGRAMQSSPRSLAEDGALPGSCATPATAGAGVTLGGGALAAVAGLRQRQCLLAVVHDRARAPVRLDSGVDVSAMADTAAEEAPWVRRSRLLLPAAFGDGSRIVWCPRYQAFGDAAGASWRPPPSPRRADDEGSPTAALGTQLAPAAIRAPASDRLATAAGDFAASPTQDYLAGSSGEDGTRLSVRSAARGLQGGARPPMSLAGSAGGASSRAGSPSSFVTEASFAMGSPEADFSPTPTGRSGRFSFVGGANAAAAGSDSAAATAHAAAVQRRMQRSKAAGARRSRASHATEGSAATASTPPAHSESLAAEAAADARGGGRRLLMTAASRLPTWSPGESGSHGSLALRFLGGDSRVKAASSRNFVFDAPDAEGRLRAVLQAGRLSEHGSRGPVTVYSLDFRWPLSPAQALAAVLGTFAWPTDERD